MDIVLSQLFRNPAPWGDYDPFARRNFDLHRRIADEVTGNRFRRGRIESIIERFTDECGPFFRHNASLEEYRKEFQLIGRAVEMIDQHSQNIDYLPQLAAHVEEVTDEQGTRFLPNDMLGYCWLLIARDIEYGVTYERCIPGGSWCGRYVSSVPLIGNHSIWCGAECEVKDQA